MIIIGVYGGSGSGKTTVTKLLHNKIENSFVLDLDKFMHYYTNIHKNELINKLGLEKIDFELEYLLNYCTKSINSINIWVQTIEKDIKKEILNSIENIRNTENTVNAIIIDWVFLPLLNDLFLKIDYTICVKCDFDKRYIRLKKRLEQNGKLNNWKEQDLLNRLTYTALDEYGYSSTYTLTNNSSLEQLQNSIENLTF